MTILNSETTTLNSKTTNFNLESLGLDDNIIKRIKLYELVLKVPGQEFSKEIEKTLIEYFEKDRTNLDYVILVNNNYQEKRIELHLTPIVGSA